MTDINADSDRNVTTGDSMASVSLRVLGIDPERGFAGGETQVMGLTCELLRMGHRAELACDPAGRLFERASADGIRCHPLRLRNSIDVVGAMRLRRILSREHYDVVHFHTSRAHSVAPFARGLAGAMVVTRRMDYRPNRLFAPYLYLRAVDGVAAISSGVADAMADAGVSRDRINIISSGVDCDYFRPPSAVERDDARRALGIESTTAAIGTVGALETRKGHPYLLEAIAEIRSPSIVCLIAGDGSMRAEFENHAARLGISAKVRFLGRIEPSRALLWALDMFVFPSLREGLGVAAIEAAACGLPTVASKVGGLGEVVGDGESGILVPPGHSAELANAISRLAGSAAERAAMGMAARERAVNRFTMRAMAEQTLALYRACLKARKDRTQCAA
jgi:glycosyltransferase involved in cell wall biosynthesis